MLSVVCLWGDSVGVVVVFVVGVVVLEGVSVAVGARLCAAEMLALRFVVHAENVDSVAVVGGDAVE